MRSSSTAIRRRESDGDSDAANTIHHTLRLFRSLCRHLSLRADPCLAAIAPIRRVDLKAADILKANGRLPDHPPPPLVGDVPGVEVGDEFIYRIELAIIRLHRPPENGIDYDTVTGFATSIVVSDRYLDSWNVSDGLLSYIGMGGFGGRKVEPKDQKMEKGNLALKRSMDAKKPVRVIYGIRYFKRNTASIFFYDGLYIVEELKKVIGSNDCFLFEFRLRRMEGQRRCEKWETLFEKKKVWGWKQLRPACDSGKKVLAK
ncbi:histone-lysine N-methyltransferase, H3 lysine-9 specific SUVH5-like [Dendrobium catenatum]|uniref:Histone-lysine N-methyltransferase, H3 lysine-9 specific SUVH5 n=1 Tax=Dendrobium catenatum TaxID=906689 RepID=A0A2I0WS20_9ASPA|nr:histone-lysine N-methyltransferase, H3 lysine-9 specific SUVH5-like [Dendrobium catenatum]PKU78472.1 Histone-lysine N-methyltransferase, H3 lysine-9 specific SUVH5 [Dendrobium catenatum]